MKTIKSKVLFLGGEGFIGRNLAYCLSDFYDCYSVGIEKSIFDKRRDRFIKKNPYKEKLDNNYKAIVHLIDNNVDIKDFSKEEKELAKNIQLNKNNHLILFSSAVVYANPDSDYGKRKRELEKFYKEYCFKEKIKLAILRLFNIYGPYQFPNRQGSLIANILYSYLNKKDIIINDFNSRRDFIYSLDMAKTVKWGIDAGFSGIDDLATNRMISIRELVDVIEKDIVKSKLNIIDKRIKEEILPFAPKSNIIKNIQLTDIKKGLQETLCFYENNFKKIKEK